MTATSTLSGWREPAADAERARWRGLATAMLVVWALVSWFAIPHGIGTSWRECDTQAIARNFVLDGFDPMRPRVDWRGRTDGAVECEFPLYELAIASVLDVYGDVEWPGRILSLLAMVVGCACLYRLLERRAGPAGATMGLAVFLCCGSPLLLASRVIPDGFSFAFGMAGLLWFERWLRRGTVTWLASATLAITLSSLQKPLSLQLGLVMFGWALAMAPQRLRDHRLWLSFATILLAVAAWLIHGCRLHQETGLSFGVVSGGDSKFPDFSHLFDLDNLGKLGWTTLAFGSSMFGLLAFAIALPLRRLNLGDFALLIATAIGILVSFRYSHDHGLGPHYHVFAAAAGAWCVAVVWPRETPRWLLLVCGIAIVGHGAWRLRDERGVRIVVNEHPIMAAAEIVRTLTNPEDLLLVRSEKPRTDVSWGRGNNFEDPRLFYQARRRGFVVAREEFDVTALTSRWQWGAKMVFDPHPASTPPATTEWLRAHGDLKFVHGMNLWVLRPLR